MQGQDFKRYVAHGTRHYGSDPWVFVRELLQNARDAGASTVRVETRTLDGERQHLRFVDDGRGMRFSDARRFLFTLFASSKTDRSNQAGRFGIGFWTVLRFAPTCIRIESRCATGAQTADHWAIEMDPELQPRATTTTLTRTGTRIDLFRASAPATTDLDAEVRKALTRFAACLERSDSSDTLLPVLLNGQAIPQGLKLSEPRQLAFRQGSIEGVVGLGPEPRLEIYARGLPVWSGRSLDELHPDARRQPFRTQLAPGISPVVHVHGRRLNVDVSRRALIDDRQLRKLRRVVGRAIARLVRQEIGSGVGEQLRVLGQRLRTVAARAWPVATAGLVLLALVLLAALAWRLALRARPDAPAVARATQKSPANGLTNGPATAARIAGDRPDDLSPGDPVAAMPVRDVEASEGAPDCGQCLGSAADLPDRYRGGTVSGPAGQGPVDLRYRPARSVWLAVLIARRFDPVMGFVADAGVAVPDQRRARACRGRCLDLDVQAGGSPRIVLPHPSQHAVVSGSARLGGQTVPIQRGSDGTWIATLDGGRGRLGYRTAPDPALRRLSIQQRSAHLRAPGLRALGRRLTRRVQAARGANRTGKIALLRRMITQHFVYDRSPELARRYRQRMGQGPWLDEVWRLGRGDCDVINGVAVLLLRRLGLPARLVIGYRGRGGRVEGGLHAWAEYHSGGRWRRVDATEWVPVASRAPAPAEIESFGAEPRAPRTSEAGPRPALSARLSSPGSPDAKSTDSAPVATAPDDRALDVDADIPAPLTQHRSLLAGLLASGVLALLILTVRRLRQRRFVVDRPGPAAAHTPDPALISSLLAGAQANPTDWRHAPALWHIRSLPVLRGRPISLARAQTLARRGRLLRGTRDSELSQLAAARGQPVLDNKDATFADLIASLAGAIDLPRLDALRPLDARRDLSPEARRLLKEIRRAIQKAGLPVDLIQATQGGDDTGVSDVDLRPLRLHTRDGWPARYVAIKLDSPIWRRITRRLGDAPQLAVYDSLRLILDHSPLLADEAALLRRRVYPWLLRRGAQ